jgi:hypothetical protein
MKTILLLITAAAAVLGVGCSAIGEDTQATLVTEITGAAIEADTILRTLSVDGTQVASTAVGLEAGIAVVQRQNGMLLATVRAGEAPTPELIAVVPEGGTMPLEMLNTADGVMRFMQVGPAGYVDPASRCFDSHQTFFRLGTFDRVYMTALGVNIQQGTQLQVNWQHNGEVVHRNGWTAPAFAERTCIAIELTSSDVAFVPGNWSATLFVNGEPVNPSSFTVLES